MSKKPHENALKPKMPITQPAKLKPMMCLFMNDGLNWGRNALTGGKLCRHYTNG